MLAKVVRETLATGPYESLADLTADVKTSTARRKLSMTADELTEVYHRIASDGTRLVPTPSSAFRRRLTEAGGHVAEVTKAEAAAIVIRLAARLGA
jgi:hypothetical protein